ncbi:hypothetical protein PoB_006367900 [Plakobranchus ocellatus]|uniref:Uncharacterized protein n=1 Tax=Plakobranchus ocellatus TaxID=259542 RepID=A0AAV4CZC0_9GAST|nr:hypothetical protein PoB_006367900 [Plakobranchus ocellatus]
MQFAACMDHVTQESSDPLLGARVPGGRFYTPLEDEECLLLNSGTDCTWTSPSTSLSWIKKMPVPWKESEIVVELGLWSILSTTPTVKSFLIVLVGTTSP